MIIFLLLIFGFICAIVWLSFAGEDLEGKILGYTFFASFFLIGPYFSGILSIEAPIPLDPNNTIDVVSIIVSLAISFIALGIYRLVDTIRCYIARRKVEKRKKDSY